MNKLADLLTKRFLRWLGSSQPIVLLNGINCRSDIHTSCRDAPHCREETLGCLLVSQSVTD